MIDDSNLKNSATLENTTNAHIRNSANRSYFAETRPTLVDDFLYDGKVNCWVKAFGRAVVNIQIPKRKKIHLSQ